MIDVMYSFSAVIFTYAFYAFIWLFIQVATPFTVAGLVRLILDETTSISVKTTNIIFGCLLVLFGILAFPFAVKSVQHLYSMDNRPPIEVVKTEVRRYKLLGMNPPKHFYVDLEDSVSKDVYNRTHVSKHCNSYRSNQLGDEYNITVVYKKQGDRTWIEFQNLYSVFCGG